MMPLLPYMDRPADTKAGCKHRCTDAAMEYFKSEVMELCHEAGLYQIDLTERQRKPRHRARVLDEEKGTGCAGSGERRPCRRGQAHQADTL